MATSYPGVYAARCTAVLGTMMTLYIPQVFGDVPLNTDRCTGATPEPGTDGFVAFEGGDASYPVWISA